MSLSPKDRQENTNSALILMLQELGEGSIGLRRFDPTSPAFAGIYPTTWKELEDQSWVEPCPTLDRRFCKLTPEGWRVAIDLVWNADPMFQDRLAKIAAALKARVKGRDTDALVSVESLAAETSIPANWILNAINSRLLEYRFRKRGAYWVGNSPNMTILVPVNFGLPL